jgi:hypothetical protein
VLRSRIRELRFPARDAKAPRRVVNLPYTSLGPLFKGRDAVIAQLRQRLASGPCQAIHRLGGVGKTRLAIEYAWRHAGNYSALLFASARSAVDLRTNLAGFCDPLVGLAQQRYVKSHRILANCRAVKDFRRFRNSQTGLGLVGQFWGLDSDRILKLILREIILSQEGHHTGLSDA